MSRTDPRVEKMRADLMYAYQYRKRANALDNLGGLLRCEYPGTRSKVHVKGWRWWRTSDSSEAEREIVLTDDERREFRDWCEERATKLRKRADDIELSIAAPEESP